MPHDLTPLFDHLRKNPTHQHVRDELADLLEEQGQPEDAALLRQSIEDKARAIRRVPGGGLSPYSNTRHLTRSDATHLERALWSSTDDEGEPLDENYDITNIDPDTMASALDDWHRFRAQHRPIINDRNEEQAAHDFWLSRNGHGTGFFDAEGQYDNGHTRKHLQDSARQYGGFHLQAPEPEGVAFNHETGLWDDDNDGLPGPDDDNFDDRYADPPPRTITGTSYVDTSKDEPQRFTRLRYAAVERPARDPAAEERAMLEAIHKNPEAQHITDEYADLLDEWGRPGEAAFHRLPVMEHGYPDHPDAEHLKPTQLNAYPWSKDWHRPQTSFAFIHGVSGIQDRIPMILERIHPSDIGPYGHARHLFTKDMTGAQAKHMMKLLDQQGVPVSPTADGGAGQERYRKQIEDLPDTLQETPVRHSAYRAPKGGVVVRSTFYSGGKLIPDMEGDFMNPPQPKQEMPAMQYPPKPKGSLRSRLKAKFSKKEPPVLKYSRDAEALVRSAQENPHDSTPHHILADYLDENPHLAAHPGAVTILRSANPEHIRVENTKDGKVGVGFQKTIMPALKSQWSGAPRKQAVVLQVGMKPTGELSISGRHGRSSYGQVQDALNDASPAKGWTAQHLKMLNDVWSKYHLNHMRSGTQKQMDFLRDNPDESHSDWRHGYQNKVNALRKSGLDPDPETGEGYGAAWYKSDVPNDVIEWLAKLPASDRHY